MFSAEIPPEFHLAEWRVLTSVRLPVYSSNSRRTRSDPTRFHHAGRMPSQDVSRAERCLQKRGITARGPRSVVRMRRIMGAHPVGFGRADGPPGCTVSMRRSM